jgi:hypothetical protein
LIRVFFFTRPYQGEVMQEDSTLPKEFEKFGFWLFIIALIIAIHQFIARLIWAILIEPFTPSETFIRANIGLGAFLLPTHKGDVIDHLFQYTTNAGWILQSQLGAIFVLVVITVACWMYFHPYAGRKSNR